MWSPSTLNNAEVFNTRRTKDANPKGGDSRRTMISCDYCGRENADASQVCEGCGTKLFHVTPQPPGWDTCDDTLRKFRLRFSLICGGAFLGLSWQLNWLLLSEESPVHAYSHNHDWSDDWWMLANFPAYLLTSTLFREDSLPRIIGFWIIASLWWFALGFIFGRLALRAFTRRRSG
jgi:hypothetical protein